MITIDQIRVLDAIARLGTFSAAAEELHRATSAISYSVKGLEDSLGVEVFDRSGHRAILNSAGEVVLKRGREILNAADQLEELSNRLKQGWESELRIVIDGLLPARGIMRAVRRFNAESLPTRMQLRVEYLNGVNERFDDEEADIMLTLERPSSKNFHIRAMPPIDLCLVCRKDHPIAALNAVDRESLSSHLELIVEDSSRRKSATGRIAIGGAQIFYVSDFHTKYEALRAGLGFGWMPTHLIERDLQTKRLVPIAFSEGNRHRFVPYLVQRKRPKIGRAGRLFISLLDAEIESGHQKKTLTK